MEETKDAEYYARQSEDADIYLTTNGFIETISWVNVLGEDVNEVAAAAYDNDRMNDNKYFRKPPDLDHRVSIDDVSVVSSYYLNPSSDHELEKAPALNQVLIPLPRLTQNLLKL